MPSFRIHPEFKKNIIPLDYSNVSNNLQQISDYFKNKHIFTNDDSEYQLSFVGTKKSFYDSLKYIIIKKELSKTLSSNKTKEVINVLKNSDTNASFIQHLSAGNHLYDLSTGYIKSLINKINELVDSNYTTEVAGDQRLAFIDIRKTNHITFGQFEESNIRSILGQGQFDDLINFIKDTVLDKSIIEHYHILEYGGIYFNSSSDFSKYNDYKSYGVHSSEIEKGIEVFSSLGSTQSISYKSVSDVSLSSNNWTINSGDNPNFCYTRVQDVNFNNNEITLYASKKSGHHIYGGRVNSKTSVLYGVFEITATVPKYYTLFPAIWLYGRTSDNLECEIDIMETIDDQSFFMSSVVWNNNVYSTQTDPKITNKEIEFGETIDKMLHDKSVGPQRYVCYWTKDQVTFWLNPTINDNGSSISITSNGNKVNYSKTVTDPKSYSHILSSLQNSKQIVLNIAATGAAITDDIDGTKMVINKIKHWII